MKKSLLLLLGFVNLPLFAQSDPLIILTADVDNNERNLTFAASVAGTKVSVDWGDGNAVLSDEIALADEYGTTTTVTGIPKGDGEIKIYGDNIIQFGCDSRIDGPLVRAIDLSRATELQVLDVYSNGLTSLDLSKNLNLVTLNCYNNPLKSLDLSANTKLNRLSANNTQLTGLDLSKNTALTYLSLNQNQLTNIDLSHNTALISLYLLDNQLETLDLSNNTALTYVSVNKNKLTSLDVTSCTSLGSLFCMENQLTELRAENVTKSVNCSKNKFTFSNMPVIKAKSFFYAPQNPMPIAESVEVNQSLDLSSQDAIVGLEEEPQTTIYKWYTASGTELLPETDYSEVKGVFTFLKSQSEPVYCTMESNAYPKLSGINVLKTTEMLIKQGTDINDIMTGVLVEGYDGKIFLRNLNVSDHIAVYTINGVLVRKVCSEAQSVSFPVEPGVYLIKINDKAGQKIVVRK